MAFKRRYGNDLAYAEWHRKHMPWLYTRIGHRMHMGDRDWTEICCYCSEPLALFEEVLDNGQDLNDKNVKWTRRLAERAKIPAFLVAPRINRSQEVQEEIDKLQARIIDLQTHPFHSAIAEFRAKSIWPTHGQLQVYTPKEWADVLELIHRKHHQECRFAPGWPRRTIDGLSAALRRHCRLFPFWQSPEG